LLTEVEEGRRIVEATKLNRLGIILINDSYFSYAELRFDTRAFAQSAQSELEQAVTTQSFTPRSLGEEVNNLSTCQPFALQSFSEEVN
jgi:hypothetical protein